MMKRLLITLCLFSTFLMRSQISCDTLSIYANDTTNAVCIDTTYDKVRNFYSNNLPDHDDTQTSGNGMSSSEVLYSMCLYPDTAEYFTQLYEYEDDNSPGCSYTYQFGVGLNGIGFTPNSEEFFVNDDGSDNYGWHVEARYLFSGRFGNNGGHVNAKGSYHYHDVPFDYLKDSLGIDGSSFSSIVGYAADGFPIYYKYAYTDPMDANSGVTEFSSGYYLLDGNRPGDGLTAPDGQYSGLYYEDYGYSIDSNSSTLDSCNGRWGVTPDYPNGTYYYLLTDNYPYIPRCFKGTVLDNTFRSLSNCPASTAEDDCSPLIDAVLGCTDPFACNYNENATESDGSCTYTSYNITPTDPSTCEGIDGSIQFQPTSGTPPFTYSIDSGATFMSSMPPTEFAGLTQGEYHTISKDGDDCEVYELVVLSDPEKPTIDGEVNHITGPQPGKVTLTITGGATPYTYDWNNDGTGDFDDMKDLTSSTQGMFTVIIKDDNNCQSDSTFEISIVTFIAGTNSNEGLSVFPNPAQHSLIVESKLSTPSGYRVINKSGEEVLSGQFKNQTIDVSNLKSGHYVLELYFEEGNKSIPFVKK